MIKLKRIYEGYDEQDGFRILIDRLWPRGITKEDAHLDLWLKEIAPSNELRKSFHQENISWEDFKKRYLLELSAKKDLLEEIRQAEKENPVVTLLFGAKDLRQNQAVIIAEVLKEHA
ncbi:MAG: DUF488 family protein [Ignavibacteria bacterium]|jgi:uncharacterized protein YeaO (DUF488 family)|nr:DUF488 family protein [Ignavibacteria bacterium]MCU7502838.1 DUF488 family protein [Ignavibacteria bacterium]MCU7515668.1 DUF488 family protein [Ignavibacteria bacterium]